MSTEQDTTEDTRVIMERATRLIRAATGEDYGDGLTVTDIGIGFSEPGYGMPNESDVWVTGNWNPKRFRRAGEPKLTNDESLPERLGDALNRVGATILWLDEWARCDDCAQAVRTQPNSYSWTASYLWTDQDEIICRNCAEFSDIEKLAVNTFTYAVPTFIDLEAEGFTRHNGTYESGWHAGMNDKPEDIYNEIRRETNQDIVFQLSATSQFYIEFQAFVRDSEDEDE